MNKVISNLINKAIIDKVQKLSVGAALFHENKLLILKRRADDFMPNIYELPGGGLEAGENLLNALEREIIEETNCNISNIIGYIDHIDFPSSTGLLTRRFNFLVQPKLPIIIKLSEHEEYKWILPYEADQYNITLKTKKIIKHLINNNIQYFT